jgi:hypothetical protein
MSKESKILVDPRPIEALWAVGGDVVGRVGNQGLTHITPYEENGQMAPVLWFELYAGDRCSARVNAKYVAIVEYARVG